MSTDAVWSVVQQIAWQVPALLVFLAGAIASVVYRRRYPSAALACFVGCVLLLLTSLAVTATQAYLLALRSNGNWSMAQVGQAMSVVGIAGSVARAIGVALLVIAVFIGRERGSGDQA